MKITRLDAPRCAGGENPMWDTARQVLHYIDNTGMKVHSFDPAAGLSRTFDMPSVITTLVLREGGRRSCYVAQRNPFPRPRYWRT